MKGYSAISATIIGGEPVVNLVIQSFSERVSIDNGCMLYVYSIRTRLPAGYIRSTVNSK